CWHSWDTDEMIELELTRTQGDRRLYALEGVGTIRLEGVLSRAALADSEGTRWRFVRGGLWRPVMTATDITDATVGEFRRRGMRRGGTLRWEGREHALRPASGWRERYALAEGERELAVLDGRGWGRRPVKVMVEAVGAVDPGLLLFAAFVVRG